MTKKIIFLFIVVSLFFSFTRLVYSACNNGKCDSIEEYPKYIEELVSKKNELSSAKNTLSNQLKLLDSQYQLTLLKINQTEASINTLETEISKLTIEIEKLEIQINNLSEIYINQTIQNYKLQKRIPPFAFLFTSTLNSFLKQHRYVSTLQTNSQDYLINMETVRTNYDNQKKAKEKKQAELEILKKTLASQKLSLDRQKNAKSKLLETTKNDEKEYEKLLLEARSEYEAINSILAGNGVETKVKSVKKGERIADIIHGSSCSSSGTHLHFMVVKNNSVQNPFNYLKSIDYINNSNGDLFNPTGGWEWPMSPQIRFNQGYGDTWSIKNTWVGRIYRFHNGIDISGSSTTVTTPIDGELYRGSYYIKSGNCNLRYVKVVGQDGIHTLNLHVNY